MLEKQPFIYLPGKRAVVNLNHVVSVRQGGKGVVVYFDDLNPLPLDDRRDLVALVQGLAYCSKGLTTKQAVDEFIGAHPDDPEGGVA